MVNFLDWLQVIMFPNPSPPIYSTITPRCFYKSILHIFTRKSLNIAFALRVLWRVVRRKVEQAEKVEMRSLLVDFREIALHINWLQISIIFYSPQAPLKLLYSVKYHSIQASIIANILANAITIKKYVNYPYEDTS